MKTAYEILGSLRRFGAATVIALGILSVPAVTIEAAEGAKLDIVATAVNAGSFNTLAAALKAADLVEALQGPGPFTVLAPTDEAFAKLPTGTVESLLKPENKSKLQAILKYHVISGAVSATKLAKGDSAKTLGGSQITVSIKDGRLCVNESRVVKSDIETSNGVIHVIDQVLLPPDGGKAQARAAANPGRIIQKAISRGVPMYNHGDPKHCAIVYREAVATLVDRCDVSDDVRLRLHHAMKESDRESNWSDRAWVLRHGLDDAAQMMN